MKILRLFMICSKQVIFFAEQVFRKYRILLTGEILNEIKKKNLFICCCLFRVFEAKTCIKLKHKKNNTEQ